MNAEMRKKKRVAQFEEVFFTPLSLKKEPRERVGDPTHLHNELHDLIVMYSKGLLTSEVIDSKSIADIEKVIGVKAKPYKAYAEWETWKKTGWQVTPLEFVSEEEYEKRERKLEKLLSK